MVGQSPPREADQIVSTSLVPELGKSVMRSQWMTGTVAHKSGDVKSNPGPRNLRTVWKCNIITGKQTSIAPWSNSERTITLPQLIPTQSQREHTHTLHHTDPLQTSRYRYLKQFSLKVVK